MRTHLYAHLPPPEINHLMHLTPPYSPLMHLTPPCSPPPTKGGRTVPILLPPHICTDQGRSKLDVHTPQKQLISKEINCAGHVYMNISPPPPNYRAGYGPATDEDPSLQNESFAIWNFRGVSAKLN